jgi:UDP-glucose 4-epimerase
MAFTNFVSRCLNGEPPVIYGDGTQTRDFTYIDDIVRANERLLHTNAADGEAVNASSSDNIDIQTLAETIRDEIDPELDLVYDDRHPADVEHTHADVSKIGDLLGYEPQVPLEDGIDKFISWYESNREWYEPLLRQS